MSVKVRTSNNFITLFHSKLSSWLFFAEAIRELIRFLRRDDETHEIRRYLGTAKILQTDLVPILIHRHSNEEILDLLLRWVYFYECTIMFSLGEITILYCYRLLVNLTTPALLLYNEDIPTEKASRQYYLSIVQSLQSFKQAFADMNLWTVLSEKLTSLLALVWNEFISIELDQLKKSFSSYNHSIVKYLSMFPLSVGMAR